MASVFTELVIDCVDPEVVASFWAAVLGHEVEHEDELASVEGPEGSGPSLVFVQVPEPKSVKNRLHIDLNPADRDQEEEVERVVALGARRIDIGQGDVPWVVLADPEGNEFCILRSRLS